MRGSVIEFLKDWKDQQSVELSVFCGELCVAHFEFAIFSRRKKKEEYWRIATLNDDAEFFVRESMDLVIHFAPEHRPHMVVSVA